MFRFEIVEHMKLNPKKTSQEIQDQVARTLRRFPTELSDRRKTNELYLGKLAKFCVSLMFLCEERAFPKELAQKANGLADLYLALWRQEARRAWGATADLSQTLKNAAEKRSRGSSEAP